MAMPRLNRRQLPSDTVEMAQFLIGAVLVHRVEGERLAGRIVETEAYLPGDAASHAFRGLTRRNASMFLPTGFAYVYIAYGCWPVLNVSTEQAGIGAAVLLRALEPRDGIEAMRLTRAGARPLDIARGPGRLAAAMRVTTADDGTDFCDGGPLWLEAGVGPTGDIVATTRIGISKDADRPLRFFERGNPFVSGPRRLLKG